MVLGKLLIGMIARTAKTRKIAEGVRMEPVYTVLVLGDYPYVFGVYSTYKKAEDATTGLNEVCVITVHDFIDSKIVGDILKEIS